MADLIMSIEDDHLLLTITLKDENGNVIDISTASAVKFQNRSNTPVTDQAMVVTDAVNGVVTIQLAQYFLNIGNNNVGVEVEWGDATESYTTTDYVIKGLKT